MASSKDASIDAAAVACSLARELEERGQDYALGGAIALGFWAEPRGTLDVDVTLFLDPERPSECIHLLQDIDCEVMVSEALATLKEHGFCRAQYRGLRLDIFLPIVPFYEEAREKRARVKLEGQEIYVWSAEVLSVFKMMFFREKDLTDLRRILHVQAERLDRGWVRERLQLMYGKRDPRLSRWDEIIAAAE